MFWKHFRTDITSIEGPLSIPRTLNSAVLYADDWKQFDKLEKAVKGHGRTGWIRSGMDALLLALAGFGTKVWHKDKLIVFVIWVLALAIGLTIWLIAKTRFQHWRCPRCHSEWPGTKAEKDPRCRVCGLRLHQMA